MKTNPKMRLRELLIKVLEGKCKREDGESDEDYLNRCGNEPWMPIGFDYERSNLPNAMKKKIVVPFPIKKDKTNA